ncbi:MAG: hypothetical protein J6386_05230 [Candidatus Synoicihabitans palmerolidicus]|nr:hypothetical protein [Candidatus Synoicihabitans palmerolidicus]
MAHENKVDTGDFAGDSNGGVFVGDLTRCRYAGEDVLFQSHVHRDDDHVDAGATAKFSHPAAGRFYWIGESQTSVVFDILTCGDARGGEAENTNADAADLFYAIGGVGGVFGAFEADITGDPGETGGASGLIEHVEPEVVFMVADGEGVESQLVHGEHHGVATLGVDDGGMVGERKALNCIAGVDEDGVRVQATGATNETAYFGESIVGAFVRVVVNGVDVPVQVGGGKHGDVSAIGGGTETTAGERQNYEQTKPGNHALRNDFTGRRERAKIDTIAASHRDRTISKARGEAQCSFR